MTEIITLADRRYRWDENGRAVITMARPGVGHIMESSSPAMAASSHSARNVQRCRSSKVGQIIAHWTARASKATASL